jgi:hypothetical protein
MVGLVKRVLSFMLKYAAAGLIHLGMFMSPSLPAQIWVFQPTDRTPAGRTPEDGDGELMDRAGRRYEYDPGSPLTDREYAEWTQLTRFG